MAEKNGHSPTPSTRKNLPHWFLPFLTLFALWFVSLSILDIPVATYMRGYKAPRLLTETLEFCNGTAKFGPFLLLVLTAFISLDAEKWRMALRLLLALAIGPGLGVWAGKLLVARVRPRWFAGSHWRDTFIGFLPNVRDAKLQSFPSGDAALAFATAFILAQYFPRQRIILYFLAVGCGIARIVFQYHYLSDVILGALLGFLAARFVQYISAPTRSY